MNVVVIGLGSMGKRRIRLIKKYDDTMLIFGVDTKEERRNECKELYGIETFKTLEELILEKEVTCAFVCTSPLSHSQIINQCLNHQLHVFTELNLVSDRYEENIAIAKEKNLLLFLSSTFLYREEINKIRTSIDAVNGRLNYTYHVGQYLPDWHPWENYTNFFVGDKRSNGCREIFAIELPWLTSVFGDVVKVDVIRNKISNLKIDYYDNYLVIVQHKSGHKGTLAVDVVSRKAVRNLEVFGEELYLSWDGTAKGLKIYDYEKKMDLVINLYKEVDQLEGYSNFVVENAYYNEIVSFFDSLETGVTPIYSFDKDKQILALIDEIEGYHE
ncbi:Gfo/Idh/MocA family protein [Robertmurraya korlensis]|uniref:Gfo/Idh/MocA family protein n=1 Tax=Robertmurraya korlensis TaxID=519977 RepID=UPI000824FD86|nr:Gfo/Idh/MocA family oxidoreductase [Robertmurraya korlensis]